jgi:hypothetical protein
MDLSRQNALRAALVAYLLLIVVAVTTQNPLVETLVDVGFGFAALYFGYLVYGLRGAGVDPRVRAATAGAFVLSGLTQFVVVVIENSVLDLVSSALFVVGFVGYFVLRR